MTFGEKLQDLRRKAGMSQDTLAERLDVSRQAVSKWERDEAMPETEKVVRIAQLFGVSIDYLLLDETPEEPEPESRPQYQYQPPRYENTGAGRAEKFIRRHGYKFGYGLMAAGAVVCTIALLLYAVWPAIGNSFFGGFGDMADSMMGDLGASIEGDIPAGMEDEIVDMIYGSTGSGFFSSAVDSMQSSMNAAVKAQASLFLLGLIPGLILLAAGIFVVVKGKKIAAETWN